MPQSHCLREVSVDGLATERGDMYCCTRQPNADISNVYVEVALGRVEAESEIPQ